MLNIGIIGAGTAGLATAIAFARQGHSVQVFEKHPCLATLGAGVLIQPQGIAALHALGVGEAFTAVSVPIERLLGLSHRGWRLVDIPYQRNEARAVSRTALGGVLFDAAIKAGVQISFGCPVDDMRVEEGRAVALTSAGGFTFDILVIANGASSALPVQAGLARASSKYAWGALWGLFDLAGWPNQQLLAQRYATTRKMVGIMPTERVGDKLRVSLFWSLRCDQFEAWRARPIELWKDELLSLWPESAMLAEQITSHDQLSFATYHHARPTSLAAAPVCIVGDAAHAMSPQLGLGSTLAVQDALALASKVSLHGPVEGLREYSKARLSTVRAYQAFSKLLTPCFQMEGGGLWRDVLFASGLYVPGVQKLMYLSIAGTEKGSQ